VGSERCLRDSGGAVPERGRVGADVREAYAAAN
jgi:hypothetical protein